MLVEKSIKSPTLPIYVYCKSLMIEIKGLKIIQRSTCSEWYYIDDTCIQVSEEIIKEDHMFCL